MAPDVVYYFRPSAAAEVLINTCGSDFDTQLLLFRNVSSDAEVGASSGHTVRRRRASLVVKVLEETGLRLIPSGIRARC